MQEFIMDAVRKSDAVVVSAVRHSEKVTVGGREFIRVETEAVEVFKGGAQGQRKFVVDVRTAGKETPQMETGREYLFFLQGAGAQGADAPRLLVDLTWPVVVPEKQREAFLRCLRESVHLARVNPTGQQLKQHLIRMVQSGVPFFRSDASRVAVHVVADWNDAELEEIAATLSGKKGEGVPAGNERDNLITVVVQHGATARVVPFARAELKRGNSDAIYYGLVKRADAGVEPILWGLLRDSDVEVQSGGLRVAGLLRRGDILDAYQKQLRDDADVRLLNALGGARALLARD